MRRRAPFVAALVGACGAPESGAMHPDAAGEVFADAALDSQIEAGFGELSGMCGVLNAPELTGDQPALVRAKLTFERRYNDPADRPLLTPGGQVLVATPNAGGSSGLSEVFAYEQIARCELATLLKTETQIMYDAMGKITDMLVEIDGEKIGVSVTRVQTYPLGTPYEPATATMLLTRKLNDIKASSANVSTADRWEKQVLALLAWDDAAADVMAQTWADLDASVKADTLIVLTTTDGDDTFIYTNM